MLSDRVFLALEGGWVPMSCSGKPPCSAVNLSLRGVCTPFLPTAPPSPTGTGSPHSNATPGPAVRRSRAPLHVLAASCPARPSLSPLHHPPGQPVADSFCLIASSPGSSSSETPEELTGRQWVCSPGWGWGWGWGRREREGEMVEGQEPSSG